MKTDAPKPKTRRLGLKLLFALSLALNLAVLGAVAGAVWRHGGLAERGGADRLAGPALLRALEPEDRRAVFRAARAARPDTAPEAGQRIARLVEALSAEPLDADAVRALATEQRMQASARLGAVSEAWQARVLAMSAAERAAYARRLESFSARSPGSPRE